MSEWSALGYAITELGRISSFADQAQNQPSIVSLRVGKGGEVPAKTSPLYILDRHGDDRFADNILRALEGLPQNGDDEEERDAAEEGALIEASGYPDPASDRRFA